LRRFLLFALPLLVLLMALYDFALATFGLAPRHDLLPRLAGGGGLPGWAVLGTWGLQALALTALFLLVQGRNGGTWLAGLLSGWIAWVFRGPLLVITVVGLAGLPPRPWWSMALAWLLLYSLCGLLLGGLARTSGLHLS
jgi:hypothetical protein